MNKVKRVAVFLITAIDYVGVPMAVFCGVLTSIMMLAIVFEVVMRYGFNAPTSWSNEISGYLVVAILFLGLSYTLLVDGHVRVDIFLLRLPERGQLILTIIAYLLSLVYIVVVMWQGWEYAWKWRDTVSNTFLRLPLFPTMVIIPIGAFLLSLQFVSKIYRHFESLFAEGRGGGQQEETD